MVTEKENGASPALAVVCNSGENSLGLFDFDAATGDLRHRETIDLPGVGAPDGAYPMAVSPDRRRLYVAFRGEPHEVLTFAVDAPGRALRLLGRAPLADSMAHITTDATGRLLFSAAFRGGRVSLNPIGPDGVAEGPAAVLDAAPNMHFCCVAPGNTLLFAPSLGDDSILRYRFDVAARSLVELPGRVRVAPGSGPRHLIFDPTLRFAYLLNQTNSVVNVFAFDAGRETVEPVQQVSALPPDWRGEGWAADIHISPDGRFLYASDRKANTLACFAVDSSSGRLTPQHFTKVAAWPRAFAIAPGGRLLLSLGETTDTLELFRIDPDTGALEKRTQLATGKGPNWVEIFS